MGDVTYTRAERRAYRAQNDEATAALTGDIDRAKIQSYIRLVWTQLQAEAVTRIRYHDLPGDVDTRFLATGLFYHPGMTLSWVDHRWIAQYANVFGLLDRQANPTQWGASGWLGDVIPGQTPKNSVIIWDNLLRVSSASVLMAIVYDMAAALMTASTNIVQQRALVFPRATKNNLADAEKLAKMLNDGRIGAVKVADGPDAVGIDFLQPEIRDLTDTAFAAYQKWENMGHRWLGTDYVPVVKNERTTEHESKVGVDAITRQRELFLASQREAMAQIETLTGGDYHPWIEWVDGVPEASSMTDDAQGEMGDGNE